MRRYQRGFIVTFLGILGTTFVKILGKDSPKTKHGGWTILSPPDFED